MSIFRALGLGVFLLVLQLMVPSVSHQLERTILSFLRAGETSMNMASQMAGTTAAFSTPSTPLTLPYATPPTMF